MVVKLGVHFLHYALNQSETFEFKSSNNHAARYPGKLELDLG